jgi:surface antigen
METRFLPIAIAVMVLLSATGLTLASTEMRWLRDEPARHFTDRDWEILQQQTQEVLSSATDGETVEWTNPDSGAHGEMTPQSAAAYQGMPCRSMKMVNHAGNVSAESTFDYCQRPDGTWGLLSPSAKR